MAISWIYREDYGRAGFVMTSVRDGDGTATARQAICYSLALLAVSVLPPFSGMAGVAYLVGAVALRRRHHRRRPSASSSSARTQRPR